MSNSISRAMEAAEQAVSNLASHEFGALVRDGFQRMRKIKPVFGPPKIKTFKPLARMIRPANLSLGTQGKGSTRGILAFKPKGGGDERPIR
jgi:hypothetical protein